MTVLSLYKIARGIVTYLYHLLTLTLHLFGNLIWRSSSPQDLHNILAPLLLAIQELISRLTYHLNRYCVLPSVRFPPPVDCLRYYFDMLVGLEVPPDSIGQTWPPSTFVFVCCLHCSITLLTDQCASLNSAWQASIRFSCALNSSSFLTTSTSIWWTSSTWLTQQSFKKLHILMLTSTLCPQGLKCSHQLPLGISPLSFKLFIFSAILFFCVFNSVPARD